jgi:hypothetical protein
MAGEDRRADTVTTLQQVFIEITELEPVAPDPEERTGAHAV